MKHINKQLEVNLNIIDPGNSNKNRKAITEGVNICILIALGCAGLFLYSNVLSSKKAPILHSGITANTNLVMVDSKNVHSSTSKAEQASVLIKGHQEVGEQLVFVIDNFDKKASYKVDFGNGNHKEINNKEFSYTYSKSGNYQITLTVGYKNEAPIEFSQKIYIDEPIEISDAAYKER